MGQVVERETKDGGDGGGKYVDGAEVNTNTVKEGVKAKSSIKGETINLFTDLDPPQAPKET